MGADAKPSEPPEEAAELQPPDDPERLECDALRHLRVAGGAIVEDDRHLADAETARPQAIGHLDLEGVAVGAHALRSDRGERLAAPALEPAGRVAHRHAGDLA